VGALAKRGSAACPKAMHRLADVLAADTEAAQLARRTMPDVLDIERRVEGFVRARCAGCQFECENPVT